MIKSPKVRGSCGNQPGFSLLLILLILLTGSVFHVVGKQSLVDNFAVLDAADRVVRLNRAKQALISYAVSYADNYLPGGAGPGHLPCPDHSPINDGNEGNDGPDPPCSRKSLLLGRLPRFTWSQDLANSTDTGIVRQQNKKRIVFYADRSLRDEQMWYAVSRSHINNPINRAVNPGTAGLINVDGFGDIVAVVIDPGTRISVNKGVRPGHGALAYLEGVNADGGLNFTQPGDSSESNDLLVSISRDELMEVVTRRVGVYTVRQLMLFNNEYCKPPDGQCYPSAGDKTATCVADLLDGRLPVYTGNCPASLINNGYIQEIEATKHWFIRNRWPNFIRYSLAPECLHDYDKRCGVNMVVVDGNIADTGSPSVLERSVYWINIRVSEHDQQT